MTERRPGAKPKPRVFVSSVVEGFQTFREAARRGISAAGGEPILVNEDFPSLASSSRNAWLDGIESCDFMITVVGDRGGWTAPSGKLVVEEEYEHAVQKKIPVLAFLQKGDRDSEAKRFIEQLSHYTDGAFRRFFGTPDELSNEVERALEPLLASAMNAKTTSDFEDLPDRPLVVQHAAMLRLIIAPMRQEEVIDPVRIASSTFKDRVFAIGHSDSVRLFAYENPKEVEQKGSSLIVTQAEREGRHGEGQHVQMTLTERGTLALDLNVTGRIPRGDRFSMINSMVVAVEDMVAVLTTSLAFAAALYNDVDPFKRHQQFIYNVVLRNLEHRKIEKNPQPRSSFGMSMRNPGDIQAFASPRVITRNDLSSPASEIERAVTLLERNASD